MVRFMRIKAALLMGWIGDEGNIRGSHQKKKEVAWSCLCHGLVQGVGSAEFHMKLFSCGKRELFSDFRIYGDIVLCYSVQGSPPNVNGVAIWLWMQFVLETEDHPPCYCSHRLFCRWVQAYLFIQLQTPNSWSGWFPPPALTAG